METLHTHPAATVSILPECNYLSSGLDYYKLTMAQHAHEQEPNAEVTFTFKNRDQLNQPLSEYITVADLQARFDTIGARGFHADELVYFGTLKNEAGEQVFSSIFLDHIATNPLPPVKVKLQADEQGAEDIAITTTGPWEMATFWETIIMSEVNEAYFEKYIGTHNININDLYDEGDRRLNEKITLLQENPTIKFADFGTRRRFSLRWQKYVIERLSRECPDNLIGTSNVGIANGENLKPIGTFAHEMPMVFAGLANARGKNIRASHGSFLDGWRKRYNEDLSIALTDTFTTDFFFEDFTKEQAESWRGVRHDSGDPYEFGERLIAYYEANGIDPCSKTLVFSDGLDMQQILTLNNRFEGRIKLVYGWGTTLTNDLGLKPLNIVMKATHVTDTVTGQTADTVKLSDNPAKGTGPKELLAAYHTKYFATHTVI